MASVASGAKGAYGVKAQSKWAADIRKWMHFVCVRLYANVRVYVWIDCGSISQLVYGNFELLGALVMPYSSCNCNGFSGD